MFIAFLLVVQAGHSHVCVVVCGLVHNACFHFKWERREIEHDFPVLCNWMSYPIYLCIRSSLLHGCDTPAKLKAAPKAVSGTLIFIMLCGHGLGCMV